MHFNDLFIHLSIYGLVIFFFLFHKNGYINFYPKVHHWYKVTFYMSQILYIVTSITLLKKCQYLVPGPVHLLSVTMKNFFHMHLGFIINRIGKQNQNLNRYPFWRLEIKHIIQTLNYIQNLTVKLITWIWIFIEAMGIVTLLIGTITYWFTYKAIIWRQAFGCAVYSRIFLWTDWQIK